ncbi:MAG: glutaredoxin family protein [Pirellulales bacterium]
MLSWLNRLWSAISSPPPARLDRRVRVYTRAGCHLCDQVGQMLGRAGIEPEWIDIDSDSRLREQFDQCVPVVEILGRERFRGQVNEVLLRRILAAELNIDR